MPSGFRTGRRHPRQELRGPHHDGAAVVAQNDPAYFRYAIVFSALCYLLVLVHVRGRAGRAWAMIRRSEVCALAGGVNIVAYKVWAFTLAGFLAGIAGGLLAGGVGQLEAAPSRPASRSCSSR